MTDRDLQQHVQNALDWEPSIDAADIGVSVENGVVTLRGDVRSYPEKATAERVALGVYGVKAVANDVTARLGDGRPEPFVNADTEAAIDEMLMESFPASAGVPAARLVAVGWERAAFVDAWRDIAGGRHESQMPDG